MLREFFLRFRAFGFQNRSEKKFYRAKAQWPPKCPLSKLWRPFRRGVKCLFLRPRKWPHLAPLYRASTRPKWLILKGFLVAPSVTTLLRSDPPPCYVAPRAQRFFNSRDHTGVCRVSRLDCCCQELLVQAQQLVLVPLLYIYL